MPIVNVDQLHRDVETAKKQGKDSISIPLGSAGALLDRLFIAEGLVSKYAKHYGPPHEALPKDEKKKTEDAGTKTTIKKD